MRTLLSTDRGVAPWRYDSNATDNHVEVYVGFLRKKLAYVGSNVRIVALRRLGYQLQIANEQ